MKNNFPIIKKPTTDIIHFYKTGQSYKKRESSSSENEINPAKLIHGTIDFKDKGMKLGFNLVTEGPKGPMYQMLHIICEGDYYRLQVAGNAILIHDTQYFINESERVDKINDKSRYPDNQFPVVKLAPLPKSAQFLNVIESVFSGMATAIIHNSDYESKEAAKAAIDRHFKERNEFFQKNPKRAGKKIWGNELVPSSFSESQNCKNPRW